MIDICLLGCGGSVPTIDRSLTSLLLSYEGKKVLIDCGEGTQVSMKRLGWGFKDIDIICFTHFHADHIMGITGLLLTIANSGKTDPLFIVGPQGLTEVIKGLTVIAPYLPFYIDLVELPTTDPYYFENEILVLGDMSIYALPVQHSVPCLSYKIDIKRKRRFSKEKAEFNNVPLKLWNLLQKGNTIKELEKTYTPDMVLAEERKGLKISYCTDSRPIDDLIKFIADSDLFICEGMYGEEDKLAKALENNHMLFSEAATLAQKARVKELWLTHFSPTLTNPEDYLSMTQSIFLNTHLGQDRKVKNLNFE